MEGTKEADLVTAVLMYAMRCLAEGDQAALRNMNFGIKEIEALREMRVADLYRIESLRAHCLEIALNRQVYWPMIEHLSEQRAHGGHDSDADRGRCAAGDDAGPVRSESARLHPVAPHPAGRSLHWPATRTG